MSLCLCVQCEGKPSSFVCVSSVRASPHPLPVCPVRGQACLYTLTLTVCVSSARASLSIYTDADWLCVSVPVCPVRGQACLYILALCLCVCVSSARASPTATSRTSGPWAASCTRWPVCRRPLRGPTCRPSSTKSCRSVDPAPRPQNHAGRSALPLVHKIIQVGRSCPLVHTIMQVGRPCPSSTKSCRSVGPAPCPQNHAGRSALPLVHKIMQVGRSCPGISYYAFIQYF